MFSGIVESMGSVVRCSEPGGAAQRDLIALEIDLGDLTAGLNLGASVAVNGVCLTVVQVAGAVARFDVIGETLRKTNLGRLGAGDRVNLERSLRAADRIDGHFVQGHVDGRGRIARIEHGGEWKVWIAPDETLLEFIIPKGSIALDGVSLTIADVQDDLFSVALIPVTLERTIFGRRSAGDLLNIETDILARTIVHQLRRMHIAGPAAMQSGGRS